MFHRILVGVDDSEAAKLALERAVELVEAPPAPLRLRAGVHVGEAVMTTDDLIGHDLRGRRT